MVFEKYCIKYLANYWQKYKHNKLFHLDTSGFKNTETTTKLWNWNNSGL